MNTDAYEHELLRAAIRRCTPMVRECQPPRLGVQVMERTILLPVAHPAFVRADMIVLKGNAVQVLAGPPEYDWVAAVKRWSEWPILANTLAGTVFLACVRVLPCTVGIRSRDIFTPQFTEDAR